MLVRCRTRIRLIWPRKTHASWNRNYEGISSAFWAEAFSASGDPAFPDAAKPAAAVSRAAAVARDAAAVTRMAAAASNLLRRAVWPRRRVPQIA